MRNILISGANRGIGLNIAHKELKEGNLKKNTLSIYYLIGKK